MALSQIQCLDNHHVNWRVSESKPEFFYSEDQRLALEALIAKGREGFSDYICENGVRPFLSEQELEGLARTAEIYRPGHEHQKLESPGPGSLAPGSGEEGGDEVSLEYWPDRSEASVAELDLGWPDAISYRGVTRVSVYTQPPADGRTHIKEIVRKSIASAQRVIAVVMDVFTDVDIFRDLLDASYKRRIPVYIILDMGAIHSFLSMCGRADMHRGHLKNLRVRCCGGVEFYTRSAQKVRGSLSERFILVDGDRAISGSYSFTWLSSRLDRNLITVITGQAVETFDLQFQDLYLISRSVALNKIPMSEEPVPDPLPQTAPAIMSAAVARKYINPKYALVATGTHTSLTSSDQNSSNKNSQNPPGLKIMKDRRKSIAEVPYIHPGLAHLERAYLIPYLPTWPEPDPPSDVIGFINIRDEKKAHQVHLQRSERFEVSQAIRFSSPLTPAIKNEAISEQVKNPVHSVEPPIVNENSNAASALVQSDAVAEISKLSSKNVDHGDAPDSKGPLQPSSTSSANVIANSAISDNTESKTKLAAGPPIPKPRTLQLVIPTDAGKADIALVEIDQLEGLSGPPTKIRGQAQKRPKREGKTTKEEDSGSNAEGSQDSTKVICDKAANDNPSSLSTASEEEFFECSQPEPNVPLPNGITAGPGYNNHQGDAVNLMARLSQSMLDLRDPSHADDSTALIHQSQRLRRKGFPSPHRHIGQLFARSGSPDHNRHLIEQKGVGPLPGSTQHPSQAPVPMIGGRHYWQGQSLQPDAAKVQAHTRSGRSPCRRSPGYRKAEQARPQPPPNPSGLLGVSLSKLSSFRHLRSRAGVAQRKVTP